MEVYHLLIIAAIFSFILEMFTVTFFLLSVGIGFLLAAFGNYTDMSTEWQIYLFSIGVIVTFFAIRPIMNKIGFNADPRQTNQHALIGKTAVVVEEINGKEGTGLVKLDGDVWKAKTHDNLEIIPKNQKVEIVNLDSIIVIVRILKS